MCKKLIYSQKVRTSENKYLYNGKELQDDNLGGVSLDWYDYEFRLYDPAIARFTTIDPHSENYYKHSTYSYVLNNPINAIDPDGMDVYAINGGFKFTGVDAQNLFRQLKTSLGDQPDSKKDEKSKSEEKGSKPSESNGNEKPEYTKFQYSLARTFLLVENAINFWSDMLGGPTGENITTAEKLNYATIAIVISRVKLPVKGKIRYRPQKGWKNTKALPKAPRGGYIDELGNIWRKPKGNNLQGNFHWDVTLSKKGKRRFNTSKNHINVTQDGRIAH